MIDPLIKSGISRSNIVVIISIDANSDDANDNNNDKDKTLLHWLTLTFVE